MRITEENCYIAKHGKLFVIRIEMPNSRNFIHANEMILERIRFAREDIIGTKIGNWCTKMQEEDGYYRIHVTLHFGLQIEGDNKFLIGFHSRKLNLNDVVKEYDMLTKNWRQ